jgi:hypothetical protein
MKWFLIVLIVLAVVILLWWWWRSRSIMTASTSIARTSSTSGVARADFGSTSAAAVAAAGTTDLAVDASGASDRRDDTVTDDAAFDPGATVDDGALSDDLDAGSEWAEAAGSSADINGTQGASPSHEISTDAGDPSFDSSSDSGGGDASS